MKDGINIDQDAVQDQMVPDDLNSLAEIGRASCRERV